MEENELQNRVKGLENRVGYLERELELSVEDERFRRTVQQLFMDEDDVTLTKNQMGYNVARGSVRAEDLPHIVQKIESMEDMGWRIIGPADDEVELSVERGLNN